MKKGCNSGDISDKARDVVYETKNQAKFTNSLRDQHIFDSLYLFSSAFIPYAENLYPLKLRFAVVKTHFEQSISVHCHIVSEKKLRRAVSCSC